MEQNWSFIKDQVLRESLKAHQERCGHLEEAFSCDDIHFIQILWMGVKRKRGTLRTDNIHPTTGVGFLRKRHYQLSES